MKNIRIASLICLLGTAMFAFSSGTKILCLDCSNLKKNTKEPFAWDRLDDTEKEYRLVAIFCACCLSTEKKIKYLDKCEYTNPHFRLVDILMDYYKSDSGDSIAASLYKR